MSDKRVIKINPDIFKIPETKKKRPPKDKPIQVKTPKANNHNKSVRRKVLNMIREKQYEKNKRLEKNNTFEPVDNHHDVKSEFDESLEYLNHVAKNNRNTTVKNHDISNRNIEYQTDLLDNDVSDDFTSSYLEPMNMNIPESPKYGCLKNGNLPTYRTWVNNTRKQYPSVVTSPETNVVSPVISNEPAIQPESLQPSQIHQQTPIQQSIPSISTNDTISQYMSSKNDDSIKINELKQFQKMIQKPVPRKMRFRKKIRRRNYTVGRSRIHPKIAVLVSNKTIRKNIMNKSNILKQTPIQEVRKYLIKRGLIKVGSVAPNEVLRKMYESASMMCGDIHNHNPDNLLYNYFNYNEDNN